MSDAALACVGLQGQLTFSTSANTRLTVGTLMVYEGGGLTIGTAGAPVPASVTAELVVANRALTDPEQFGTGVLALGRVRIYGAEKTPTWVRLAQEPRAGDTTLTLAQPVTGWRVGDRLVLPDTRHLRFDEVNGWARATAQWEELTAAAISPDGRVVTLTAALRFNHFGARDGVTGAGTLRTWATSPAMSSCGRNPPSAAAGCKATSSSRTWRTWTSATPRSAIWAGRGRRRRAAGIRSAGIRSISTT
jgi:hypothetical protein